MTFDRASMPSAEGMLALWYHKTDVTQSMLAKPDTHIIPKRGKEEQANHLWEQRGTMLLPTHLNLPTVRVVSVCPNTPVVGSLWVPCKFNVFVNEIIYEKALSLFLNSSVGVLAILGDRTNKKPSYPQLSMDDLRKLVVPDFAAIGESAVRRLALAYDALCKRVLLPLPQMDDDPVRRELDAAVCAALDIDPERVATIRRHLAAEPSVTGKRYDGLG